ncbi:discoidin domain-containing protein [Flavobacterium sp.]|uniref:discoidin domain-containing protein n=1 Tax=Flavobacterium sp. TaxID=239 RepID=UPI0035271B2F
MEIIGPQQNHYFQRQFIFENGTHLKISDIQKYVNPTDQNTYLFRQTTMMNTFHSSNILACPVIEAESKSFKNKLKIELKSQNPNDEIYYIFKEALEGKPTWIKYSKPFEITESKQILAKVVNKKQESSIVSAQFFKKPNNYTVELKSKYNPQYHAGGPEGLLDGIYGNENWRKGEWQGYQSQDFEAVIDLQKETEISGISASFLQDTRAWILYPTQVEYYVSDDNINFTLAATVKNKVNANDYEVQTQKLTAEINKKGRYVKVIARNFGKLPEWHQGFLYNGDAFIFIDEIEIN